MSCPIGLDRIHCPNCYFQRHGECHYGQVTDEVKVGVVRPLVEGATERGSNTKATLPLTKIKEFKELTENVEKPSH